MKSHQFNARHFGHEYAFDVLTTGVAERIDGDGDYVQFQRLLSETTEGDGIHFEFRDPLHSGYGIVDSVSLTKDQLTIHLAKPFESMPEVTGFLVFLDMEQELWEALRNDLAAIFEHEGDKLKTKEG